jgi:hypothetical protein
VTVHALAGMVGDDCAALRGSFEASPASRISCASPAIRHDTDQQLRDAFGLLTEGP